MIGDITHISNEIIVLPEYRPIKGLKCPISLGTIQHPVYLRGCEHVFEREVIEKFFREALLVERRVEGKVYMKSEVKCPKCRHIYSISKFQIKLGNRVQAIDAFFKKIFIVPLVTIEINERLEKAKENEKQLKKSIREIEECKTQIIEFSKILDQSNEQYKQMLSLKDIEINDLKDEIESISTVRKISAIVMVGGVGTLTLGCVIVFFAKNNGITLPVVPIPQLPSLPDIPKI